LKQLIGIALSRHRAAAALSVLLLACNGVETTTSGYVDVLPNHSEGACDDVVPGFLRLDGGEQGVRIVSGDELCRFPSVRRELPAGLYAVSWQPSDDADQDEHWVLGGPAVVSVFAGQITRLRVRQIADDRELLSRSP
jgi:hypothetical protein